MAENKGHKKQVKKKRKFVRAVNGRTLVAVALLIGCMFIAASSVISSTRVKKADLSYTDMQDMIDNGEVESITYYSGGQTISVYTTDGQVYSVVNPGYDEFKKDLLEEGVKINVAESTMEDALMAFFVQLPMLLLMCALIYALLSAYGSAGKQIFKLFKPEEIITFDDIAGMSETKEEVQFAVEQIKNAKTLREKGAKPCRGILFTGPPGNGKTMLAKAIAGEAGVAFISCSGADFIEMFVGLGAARVRSLWKMAELNSPCVLFIDEVDAVGKRRSGSGNAADNESNQTLNALLQKMDGLETTSGIYVIAATNRIEDLDPALLRPGRFDKILRIEPPRNKKDREEIINLYLKGKDLEEDVTAEKVNYIFYGMSAAEIANTLNEAVLCSVRHGRNGKVSIKDIDEASMKLRMQGVVTSYISDEDKRRSAIHEAGHAIMSLLSGRDVAKVSIIPYSSGVGGVTMQDGTKLEDKKLRTRKDLINDIRILLAGYSAEKIITGDVSIGSSNDLMKASEISFGILNTYGMRTGNLINQAHLKQVGLISDIGNKPIDGANELLTKELDKTMTMLSDYEDAIKKLANQLLSDEVIINLKADKFFDMQNDKLAGLIGGD